MKLISSGLINKIVDIDEKKLRASNKDPADLNQAILARLRYQTPNGLQKKDPLSDPYLFMVAFQRIVM